MRWSLHWQHTSVCQSQIKIKCFVNQKWQLRVKYKQKCYVILGDLQMKLVTDIPVIVFINALFCVKNLHILLHVEIRETISPLLFLVFEEHILLAGAFNKFKNQQDHQE